MRRVLMIGLDGFDIALAESFIRAGTLPNLARLRARSARFDLDHGLDKYSGLAWEHVASGRAPSDGARWSAVTFDPATYGARQEATSSRPFLADIAAKIVVFDAPYCDLRQARNATGLTHWGAHDPGVLPASRPAGLHEEIQQIFGPYPATQWIYGFCWPSAERTRAAGAALARAVEMRADVACWLLAERLPDWQLALVVVSECHSAVEPMWHGVDPSHPLHSIESAAPAGAALREVYVAIDAMIGQLERTFPDTVLLVFAMHGMGPNDSDVASMVLLPELVYRSAFGVPYLRPIAYPRVSAGGVPLLPENAIWEEEMLAAVPRMSPQPPVRHGALRGLARMMGLAAADPPAVQADPSGIAWIPAARYSRFWPRMPAFALPAYYDGRVRVNLEGREKSGVVSLGDYQRVCGDVIDLLQDCRNLLTGEPVIEAIHWPKKKHPEAVGPSEADLYVLWRSAPVGFSTPALGDIGPVPYRRTGGHTGSRGFLYLAGDGIAPVAAGVASSFDVVPTVLDLLGEERPAYVSGRSLRERCALTV